MADKMTPTTASTDLRDFDAVLFEKMKDIHPGIANLELYEFSYALKNLRPAAGWSSVQLPGSREIESRVNERGFYEVIQTKRVVDGKIILDDAIVNLTRQLLIGLVSGEYSSDWINRNFYFDIRAFLFFHRTKYFNDEVIAHFGEKPFLQFETRQKGLEEVQEIGYKAFSQANAEIDQAFIDAVLKIVSARGTPILLTLAGPTAAGKTEIMARLFAAFAAQGKRITTIEMDNFLLDRDIRGEKPMGVATCHFEIFKQSLREIQAGKQVTIPRYDFINATSSHDETGRLKPGRAPLVVKPADVIFIEGNFPFQLPEISEAIGIKVVYLTDDPIRLKRKWKRDIDFRKKYDPTFFVNRYFKTQFLRGDDCYALQMKCCDIVVDTTGASLWVTPEILSILGRL
jgi:uridine kinase